MSDYMGDLTSLESVVLAEQKVATQSTSEKAGSDLDMTDFLTLMCAMFENQSIDDTVDTGEMMEQLVQMSVITAVNNLTDLLTEATSLNYATSLVGKEVTIGRWINGELTEMVGTVTGTGTLNGQQIIFIGEESYYLTDIMAVGRLPEEVKDPALNDGTALDDEETEDAEETGSSVDEIVDNTETTE